MPVNYAAMEGPEWGRELAGIAQFEATSFSLALKVVGATVAACRFVRLLFANGLQVAPCRRIERRGRFIGFELFDAP